jgi:hypothetical protein
MQRLIAVLLLLATLAPTALADQPQWSFEGLMPAWFQKHEPLLPTVYTPEGAVLSPEQIAGCVDVRPGDPVVLIRAGEVVGRGTIGEIVAQRRDDALNRRALFFRAFGLPDSVEVPDAPAGPAVLEGAGYDLYVLTDKPVEVLAPDPAYTDITWGVHDYCVRVGRLRFAVIREFWPRTQLYRGWQIIKFEDPGNLKVFADNTFQPQ